jgi:MtN3 and saliva related transmembrane protein
VLSISMATSIGLVAGCLSSWSLVPQLLKCWRDGLTEAVSKKMFATRAFGLVLWIVYGFFAGSPPVVIFSSINLALSITILVLTLRKLVTSRSSHHLDASAVVSTRPSKCAMTTARPVATEL